ncbi:three component ABC system middle component [Micromonospora chalcea]|uniref:three component ABC system middle component n=1 Tax=Micromonospora TaxID=1873 RepID=UPI0033D4A16B
MTSDTQPNEFGISYTTFEEEALFNPAFIALLYARVVQGWQQEGHGEEGAPAHLSSLAVTMALHSPTRLLAPKTIRTSFVDWVQQNPDINAFFPRAALGLTPLVKDGLIFALVNDVCRWTSPASIMLGQRLSKTIRGDTPDFLSCQRGAVFFGRWLSRSGRPSSIFALLGVRP